MSPADPRHGTNAGYIAHAVTRTPPCDDCKEAHATYKRKRRARQYFARGPLMIDGTGTRRRLQALAALGWSLSFIDERLGHSAGVASRFVALDGPVRRTTAAQYARIYNELSMTCPTGAYADRARAMARRKGWPPPLAWDDDKIDDPVHSPDRSVHLPNRFSIDEVVVHRVLVGENLRTTRAEKQEVMRRWLERGGSQAALCRRMGWKQGRYAQAPVENSLGTGPLSQDDETPAQRKAS